MFYRAIFTQLIRFLSGKEFFLLLGPRQVGKTTLLKQLEEKLKREGERTYFFNLEDFSVLADYNEDPKNLLSYVKLEKKRKIYVFIDEIQYLENPSNFLKYFYDQYADQIKIICTGSASLEIKSKIQDSLVGRLYTFRISPLTFDEYLVFKKSNFREYLKNKSLSAGQQKKLQKLIEEFLLYGGMPAVVLKNSFSEKEKLLKNYVQTYIQKDIRSIAVISDIIKYNATMKVLTSQIGNLLNINNVAQTIGLSYPTTKRYVDILFFTHIVYLIPPYLQKINRQIQKMHKLYFFDLGIRNAVLNNFNSIEYRADRGALFENMIANELLAKEKILYFYRTKNDAEIDFIVDDKFLHLLEAKYKDLDRLVVPKIFYNFGETQKKQRKWIINTFSRDRSKNVEAIPFFQINEIFN